MDLLNDVLYHLSCPSCGSDWWDNNAFPSYCPYCNANRIPELIVKKDKEQQVYRNEKDDTDWRNLKGCLNMIEVTSGDEYKEEL